MKEEYVSKIVRTWLPKLANVFAKLIIWAEREALRENLPTRFTSLKIVSASLTILKYILNALLI